jgi:hypothetical protein
MLENTPLIALLAVSLAGLLIWRVRPDTVRRLPWWTFALAAAIFWAALALILILTAWGFFYSYFAPGYYAYVAPLAALVVYPLWSLGLRWAALRLPGHPVLSFCLLGGLQGVFEHVVAVERLHLLVVPFLAEATPAGIYALAFFEYALYWGVVLLLAAVIGRVRGRVPPGRDPAAVGPAG